MNARLSCVSGKVSSLRYSLEERQSKAGESERNATLLSPILLALSGNGGLAVGNMAVNYGMSIAKGKAYWVEFEVDGRTLKGWLGGVYFKDGDVVDVVVEGNESLLAVNSFDERVIAILPPCGSSPRMIYKYMRYTFIGILLFLLLFLGVGFFFAAAREDLAALISIALPCAISVALFVAIGANWRELLHALRTRKILTALELPEADSLNLSTRSYELLGKGKIQGSVGTVYRY
ncbi:hypothetical protein [Paraburkholderia fungorum]|uniref:hypothetical protein n=1 Tax=Paraburkholderia fungorum TaxID=134537 RepID=UPI001C1EDDCF|nr:hypothetical protein [Paraburkholderia fungorum]MBU7438560.1 hypothetical protein [Paraburkholderia fungorum]